MLDALDTEEALAAPADSDPRWSNDHPVLRELARAHESARVNALRAGALRGVRL